MQAGIIGLGLIGGSMGLALKKTKMFKEIKGYDENPVHSKQALNLGLVDECVNIEELQECDVVFIAVPLGSVQSCLKQFKNVKKSFTLIDLSSSKYEISKIVPDELRKNFVNVHPMSGTEFSGPKAAKADLFTNKIVIFTDTNDCGEFQLAFAKEIFLNLEMQIVKMTSKHHDKSVAYISHLPHVLSFALSCTVLDQESPEDFLSLIGGGFKSMIRLANSSAITWSDIFEFNREHLLHSINDFKSNLNEIEEILDKKQWDKLRDFITKSNKIYEYL